MAYEINININGATTDNRVGSNNAGTNVAAGAVAGRLASGPPTSTGLMGLMTGGRGKNAADMAKGREFGRDLIRGALRGRNTPDLQLFSGTERAEQLAKGSVRYLKNVSGKQYAGVASAGLALGISAANLYSNELSIRGNTDQSDRIRATTDGLTEGATVVGAFALLGPVGGGVAVASLAWKYAQENRKLIKQLQTENIRSAYYSRRLVYDVSEVR